MTAWLGRRIGAKKHGGDGAKKPKKSAGKAEGHARQGSNARQGSAGGADEREAARIRTDIGMSMKTQLRLLKAFKDIESRGTRTVTRTKFRRVKAEVASFPARSDTPQGYAWRWRPALRRCSEQLSADMTRSGVGERGKSARARDAAQHLGPGRIRPCPFDGRARRPAALRRPDGPT